MDPDWIIINNIHTQKLIEAPNDWGISSDFIRWIRVEPLHQHAKSHCDRWWQLKVVAAVSALAECQRAFKYLEAWRNKWWEIDWNGWKWMRNETHLKLKLSYHSYLGSPGILQFHCHAKLRSFATALNLRPVHCFCLETKLPSSDLCTPIVCKFWHSLAFCVFGWFECVLLPGWFDEMQIDCLVTQLDLPATDQWFYKQVAASATANTMVSSWSCPRSAGLSCQAVDTKLCLYL